jgi:hypothetical protein
MREGSAHVLAVVVSGLVECATGTTGSGLIQAPVVPKQQHFRADIKSISA